jgi:EmrB/QacA subfamily drug resistance transporter
MTKQQRLVLTISILASFVAFLDGSVVNVALPAISRELGGGLTVQQWVVDAYLISLGALILIAGSLSDLIGRKKVLFAGLTGFAVTSLLCAIAPNALFLIISRGLQGVAGALLVPSSLALIMSAFSGSSGGKAIGTWTAWTAMAFLFGPLLGGFMVDSLSWRLIFAINLLPIAVTLWLMRFLHLPEQIRGNAKIDLWGALLCVVGLGAPVFALIEQPHYGWASPSIYLPLVLGLVAFMVFLWHEKWTTNPMLPLRLFSVRNFWVGNIATTFIYAGLSVATFLIAIFVQQVGGYSALAAGLALLPVTLIMFVLSPRFGALADKHGPRFFMAAGPLVAGTGFFLLLRIDRSVTYWSQIFPGVALFGIGLSMTVAPLTVAILEAIDRQQAGIASAVNNAVARIAGLVAISCIAVVTGTHLSLESFHKGIALTAVLLFFGGIISGLGIRNNKKLAAK